MSFASALHAFVRHVLMLFRRGVLLLSLAYLFPAHGLDFPPQVPTAKPSADPASLGEVVRAVVLNRWSAHLLDEVQQIGGLIGATETRPPIDLALPIGAAATCVGASLLAAGMLMTSPKRLYGRRLWIVEICSLLIIAAASHLLVF